MAEGLHHQIGGEAEAGEVLQLVARHRAGGVLRADGGHLRLAIGAGAHALAFGQAAGAADHLLRQREALAGVGGTAGRRNRVETGRPSASRALGGEAAADDQRDAAAGAHFVEEHVGLELELGDDLAVLERLALIGAQLDDVAHVHLGHVELDRQGAGVFHGVVEDRGDLACRGTRRRSACSGRKGCPRP